MKNKITTTLSCFFTILLVHGLASCNANQPEKADSGTLLTGQKPIQGKPPDTLKLSPAEAHQTFGYDFNRDKVTDWVDVANTPEQYDYAVAVYLSQPDGGYLDVNPVSFNPGGAYDEPWRVSAKLTDSGDLLITNNNASPFSSSDKQNSYRFRLIKGEFVLQEYTHGYTGHSFGKYRTSHIFDLANRTYRKSDTERCDYEPQKPCPSAVTKRLGNVPTLNLRNFAGYNRVDMVADLEKYAIK